MQNEAEPPTAQMSEMTLDDDDSAGPWVQVVMKKGKGQRKTSQR